MASNENHHGYNVNAISEKEKKKFECMLCLAIIKEATHGCKNHVFCKECLKDYIVSIERTEDSMAIRMKCPSGCGQTFNKNELISNNFADQLINQISCRCKDCDWGGELLDFVQVHDGKCIEKEVPCHLCSILLKRKYMDHHLKDECTHRPVVCRGCQKNFPFVDHLKHEESCDDIKVQCSFTNFGCNVQETRRNMIVHENNSCQNHLSLIAKYFTDENKQLKEETKQLKEETKQLKEENKQLNEETKQSKEETKLLKQENKQVKELLEMKIKVMDWKLVNIPHILLKEPADHFFHFPAVDEMHIKKIDSLSPDDLFHCFSKNNFTWIIEHMANECDVLKNYKEELHKLLLSTKTIMFNVYSQKFYFFQIDDFKDYKSEDFILKKDGNIFHFEKYNNRCQLMFHISKWVIEIKTSIMQIGIKKPGERFKISTLPHLSSNYFCIRP